MTRGEKPGGFARRRLLRFVPLFLIALGSLLFFATDLNEVYTFELLARKHDAYLAWVERHPVRAVFNFIGVYVLIAAFALPLSTLMTIASGYLFGPWLGAAMSLAGATIGGSLLFLAARTALGDVLRRYAQGAVKRLEEGFRKDAFSYLLVARLVPAAPFFAVNIAAGLLSVRLGTYLAATVLGMIPAAFIYASTGLGLETLIEAGERPRFDLLLTPEIFVPLAGLALLALIPVLLRQRRRRRG
jgi:uncharacterized membrane protein YdjX (TVP38/TMEM64 family)